MLRALLTRDLGRLAATSTQIIHAGAYHSGMSISAIEILSQQPANLLVTGVHPLGAEYEAQQCVLNICHLLSQTGKVSTVTGGRRNGLWRSRTLCINGRSKRKPIK
jgi:hypothetical protein